MWGTVIRWFPIVDGLRNYRQSDLRGDLIAGLTTAVMLIPQGMAYAMLAGLPPIVGLYASTIPLVVYALLGTSRQLAVGPVAMVSLMTAAAVGAQTEPGSAQYIEYAVLLALMVGGVQWLMGVARLGFLANFLSHPVISGFTSAAALIIGLSQLKHLVGVDIPRSPHVHEILLAAITRIAEIEPLTLAIGVASIALLLLLQRLSPLVPRALAVVVASSLLVWGLGLDQRGVAIVGDVPAGLPAASFPTWSLGVIGSLFPSALAISLVAFMESVSVAKALANRYQYEIDANRELAGLGLANVVGSFFGAYTVTGGFSRTAVNAQAGARTPLASIITAAFVAVTLIFFTPLFYYLPKAVLAAIVMTAVFGLIDVREVIHLFRVNRVDLALLVLTFAVTLITGIEAGILAGVVASLVWVVVRTTRPHVAVLGRLPNRTTYRNILRHPEAETIPGIIVLRIDAQLYYGNSSFLKETVNKLMGASDVSVRAVVLDATSVNNVDSSADRALHALIGELSRREVGFFLAGVKGPVSDALRRSGFLHELGDHHVHLEVHEAVEAAVAYSPRPAQQPPVAPEDPRETARPTAWSAAHSQA
jgi:SulP family sulfate permease